MFMFKSTGSVLRNRLNSVPKWKLALKNWYHFKRNYPQYGLLSDDVIFETPIVKEALKRLPRDVFHARICRISRATALSTARQVLPRNEWVRYEDDYSYLGDLIEQITRENIEAKWGKLDNNGNVEFDKMKNEWEKMVLEYENKKK